MGDPIVIWPPGICDGYPGCYQDACASQLGSAYYDCSDFYTVEMGAAACCPLGG